MHLQFLGNTYEKKAQTLMQGEAIQLQYRRQVYVAHQAAVAQKAFNNVVMLRYRGVSYRKSLNVG